MGEAVLTESMCEEFDRLGYVVVRGMLPRDQVAGLSAEVDRLTAPGYENPVGDYYYENESGSGGRLLRRVERVCAMSPAIDALFRGVISEGASSLLREPASFFKDKLNMKLPGGAGYRPHLDGYFRWRDAQGRERRGWREYASYFISVQISLDPATRENGCIQMAPIEQTLEVFGQEFDAILDRLDGRGPEVAESDLARITLTHVETEPGDVVYFDWRNVHGSAANHSTGSRRILYGTYNRSAEGEHLETYYEDKRGSLEPVARKSLG